MNRKNDRTDQSASSTDTPDVSSAGTPQRSQANARENVQQQAEEALRKSEHLFRSLFECHSAINLLLDAETGSILDANEAAVQFYGWPLEELRRMNIQQINRLPPEALISCLAEAASARCNRFEFSHQRADGSIREVEVFSNKIEIAGKSLLFSSIHDNTERNRARESLRESEERFRKVLLDIPSVAVKGYRPDGTLFYWNRASERLHGYSEQEAMGRSVVELIIPAQRRPEVEKAIRRMVEEGQPIPPSEVSLLRKDGSEVAVLSSHALIQLSDGTQELFCLDIDLTERNQDEEALRQQTAAVMSAKAREEHEKRLLSTVLEALPVGLAIVDTKGECIRANSAYERIWGGSSPRDRTGAENTACRAWWTVTGEPVAPDQWASVIAAETGKPTIGQMMRVQGSDGIEKFVINSASPVYDTEGRLVGCAVATQDITELKRAEQALLENKIDFARAQEVGSIGSWRLDVRQNVLSWSGETYRIFGIPLGTPLHYDMFLSLVHPDDRALVDAHWQAALGGERYDIEHRIVVAGQIKWVREKAYLECDEDGALIGGFGITQDITERKLVEEALRKSEERYRVLAETMLQGVVHQDANGTVVAMNQAAEHILGKKAEQALGNGSQHQDQPAIRENGEEFPAPEHPSMVALQTGQPVRGMIMGVFNPQRGDYRWLSIDAVPIFSQGASSPTEVYIVFEDISERRQAETLIKSQIEELRASNEELEIFNNAAVKRELRMIELKKEINELCEQAGQPPRYPLDFDVEPPI